MRKFYFNGGSSPLSNSRSPSPVLQILAAHYRFQARRSSKRPSLRHGMILIALLTIFMLAVFLPSETPPEGNMVDESFLLGENIPSVRYYDLTQATGSSRGWEREERI